MSTPPPPPPDTSSGGDDEPFADLPAAGRTQWVSIGVTAVFFWVIFGWLLPMFIDFRDVWQAIRGLSVGQVLVLGALGLVWMFVESIVSTALVPGLKPWPGFRSWAASNAASVGPSPLDLAVRYGMYAEVGVAAGAAGAGIFLSGIFGFGIRLIIPTIAIGSLALAGRTGPTGTTVAIVAVIGFFLTAAFLGVTVGWAPFARWLGRTGERLHNRIATRWFRREEVSGLEVAAAEFRLQMVAVLARRWPLSFGAAILGQVLTMTIFLLSYRFIGLGPTVVGTLEVFVAYAAGLIANFIPGVPGGVGASELIHVIYLTEATGLDIADEVAAAGFTHRVFTWVIPVLIGTVFLVGWLRRRSRAAADRLQGREG